MFKLTFTSAAVIACLAGCNGQRADSSPPEDPSGVELEYNDPESTEAETIEEEEYTETEEAEPEEAEPETTEGEEAPAAEAPAEPSPPQKSCAGLPQKTCEVTVGCAWSTKPEGCIEQ